MAKVLFTSNVNSVVEKKKKTETTRELRSHCNHRTQNYMTENKMSKVPTRENPSAQTSLRKLSNLWQACIPTVCIAGQRLANSSPAEFRLFTGWNTAVNTFFFFLIFIHLYQQDCYLRKWTSCVG